MEENIGEAFALDKTLTATAKDEIVVQSIEKLLTKDSPQLETMKMQVGTAQLTLNVTVY